MRHDENGVPEPTRLLDEDADLRELGGLLDEVRRAWPLPSVAKLRDAQVAAAVRQARELATTPPARPRPAARRATGVALVAVLGVFGAGVGVAAATGGNPLALLPAVRHDPAPAVPASATPSQAQAPRPRPTPSPAAPAPQATAKPRPAGAGVPQAPARPTALPTQAQANPRPGEPQGNAGEGTGKPSDTPGGKPTVNPGRGHDKPERPTKSKTPKPERPGRAAAGE